MHHLDIDSRPLGRILIVALQTTDNTFLLHALCLLIDTKVM